MAAPGENRVAVIESLTGNVRGNITTSNLAGDKPLAAAFHHRGRWAAVLSGSAGGGELTVVETDSGRETSRIRIPVTGEVLQFCDDDHLLIDGESLVSLTKERVVWRYQLTTGMHSRDGLGGYHWYVSAINPSDKSYIICGASLPEDPAKKEIQVEREDREHRDAAVRPDQSRSRDVRPRRSAHHQAHQGNIHQALHGRGSAHFGRRSVRAHD